MNKYIHISNASDIITIREFGELEFVDRTVGFPFLHLQKLLLASDDKSITRAELVRSLVPAYIPFDNWRENFDKKFIKPLEKNGLIKIQQEPSIIVSMNVYDPNEEWTFHIDKNTVAKQEKHLRKNNAQALISRLIGENGISDMASILKLSEDDFIQDITKLRHIINGETITDIQIVAIMHYALANKYLQKNIKR